jgi:hypothetical protein
MPKEHATGYSHGDYVKGLPNTYPRHSLDAAQAEYHSARQHLPSNAEYLRKYPDHRSWATGTQDRFDEAEKALIKATAKHTGKSLRAVQLEFKERGNKAHSAADTIKKAYKKHKTSKAGRRHTRGRKTRSTRHR